MPFWQAIKSCAHCRFFRREDPSEDGGYCTWRAAKPPFWIGHTHADHDHSVMDCDGKDCQAYDHLPDKDRPHPLDKAAWYMTDVQAGDTITVRTYSVGAVTYIAARVKSYHRGFAVIEMMNRSYRMRLKDSKRGRAGTIIDLPDWGLDVEAPVQRKDREQYAMEKALALLANVKAGDVITLVDVLNGNQYRGERVTAVSKARISLTIDGRRRWMHREGPLAGVIEGELWVLELTV